MKDPEKAERDRLFLCLYMQGKSYAQISEATGLSHLAIQKRVTRQKLKALRDKSEAVAPATRPLTLRQRSEVVRNNIAVDLQVSSERLSELRRSRNPILEKERAQVVSTIVNASDKVFGWSETNPLGKGPFNFELLDSCYTIDLEAGEKRGMHETIKLTPEEIADYKAQFAAAKAGKAPPPPAIDVPHDANANGANGHHAENGS